MTDQIASAIAPTGDTTGEIGSFYRAIWSSALDAGERYRLTLIAEIALIVAWFVIRTLFDVEGRAYMAWVAVVGAVAVIAPRSGLLVFIATSVFFEPDSLARTLGPRELIVLPLALGVAIQVGRARPVWRPGWPIWLGIALVVGTALGVVHTFLRFDDAVAWHAAQSWLGNMAAPIILLVAAAWTARDGSLRALAVAVTVGVIASATSLVEYLAPGTISAGPFAWVGFWKDFGARLAGTIPSPNALSAQLIAPTALLLAAALFARDRRLRIAAVTGALPLLLANYLTFSRAPLLAAYAFAVIAAWRIRRWMGLAVLVGGLAVGAVLLPGYLQLRSESAGGLQPGSVLVATDAYRFRAWEAATSMAADAPLTGQGYLAYKELADAYGDPLLGSPHNEWLRLFAEEGVIVGLIGLAFIVAAGVVLATVPGWLGTGSLAGYAGFVIAATFNNPFLFVRVSAVAFTVIGVGLALAERARKAPDPPVQGHVADTARRTAEPGRPTVH